MNDLQALMSLQDIAIDPIDARTLQKLDGLKHLTLKL